MYVTIFYRNLLNNNFFWNESHIFSVRNKSYIIESLRKFIYKKFDYFLVPNNLSLDFVKSYNKKARSFFLPNTINQKIFKRDILNQNFEFPGLTLNSNKINLIQVSQLESRKGIIELLDCFINLPKLIQDRFNLILIGNGSLKNKTKDKVKENHNVFLIDYINQQDLSILYTKIDFFILSSFQDPNPLSPIEAVFSGKVIFVSKYLGNTYELIPNNYKSKLIFDPNEDFSSIFYSMIDLKNDINSYNSIAHDLYQNVNERWDIFKVCTNLINDLISINE
jgi:glycosyltransferase involved in cell wall biosynthesis